MARLWLFACSFTCSPLPQVVAFWRKLEDPRVAIAIRHIYIPSQGVHSHIGGLAEVALAIARFESLPQDYQGLVSPIRPQLEDLQGQEPQLQADVQRVSKVQARVPVD